MTRRRAGQRQFELVVSILGPRCRKVIARVCNLLVVGALLPAAAAPLEPGNAAWNVNMNPAGSDPSQYFGAWPGHQYFPSPADWRAQSVYQFVTDRFSDGDPRNNTALHGGYDLGTVKTRHGGDFKGIQNRLDYIKSLGFTAIWLSPVFQNRENDYHGYHQIDFTLLDRRFGTLQAFRELVDAAHDRGLYVIVDMVVNHMADVYYFEGHEHSAAPFRLHEGEYRLFPRKPGESYRDFQVDNTKYPTGHYPTLYGNGGWPHVDQWGQGSYWFSDFHHNGNLHDYGDVWQNHLGKIYGTLDDLRTTHPRVQDKLIAMTRALISSTDIDGIRMDTPMQVPLYFFQRWAPAVRAHAAGLGKDNFFIFGEFFTSRERAATMTGRGRSPNQYGNPYAFIGNEYTLDSGINYPFYFWAMQAVRDQANYQLPGIKSNYDADRWAYDFYNPRRNEVRYRHLNFFNNHDQWRIAAAPDGFQKTDLASAIIAFWPGIPLFYYGDEQGFLTFESALDGWSREDMTTSMAWDQLPTVNGKNPAQGDNFDMTSPHFRWVQKLMNVRRQYPALRNTDDVVERWVQPEGNNGIYAYTRVWGAPANWALVAFNTWSAPLKAGAELGALRTGWNQGDVIVNVLSPMERYTLGPNGAIDTLWLGPYEAKVFVLENSLQALDPVIRHVSPGHDQKITGNSVTISLSFSEPMDEASVKQAFRFNGQPVPPGQLSYTPAQPRLQFTTTVADGVHVIELLDTAQSLAGKTLHGSFRSRFRKGSAANILIAADSVPGNSIEDPTLVEVVDAAGQIILHHKATGALKLRVKADGDDWSNWMDYATDTPWNMGPATPGRGLTVQYWVDGSAAYFVTGRVPGGDLRRTVVFLRAPTDPGQNVFVRGGIDHVYAASNLGLACADTNHLCAIPIQHLNASNPGTAGWKTGDGYLDWYGAEPGQQPGAQGTPMDWTTNYWNSAWGPVRTVDDDGFGQTPLNLWGDHYWMLDVEMDCSRTVNGWFEFKSFVSNGPGWEGNISQHGAPYLSGNHFARCGEISVFRRNENNAQFFPPPP